MEIATTEPIELPSVADVTPMKKLILEEILERIIATPKMAKPVIKQEEKKIAWSGKPSSYSSPAWLKQFYAGKGDKLQYSNMSRPERFPKMMMAAKELQPDAKRILSFGCSTGEECQSLFEHFPHAEQIVGVDLSHSAIITARQRNKSDKIVFTDELEVLGQFDLITCFQVLFCLVEEIPEERWKRVLCKLEKHIAPNGIIMCYTSDHPLEKVFAIDKYEPLNVWTRKHNKKPDGKDYYNGYYKRRPL